jgi:hypothetical protein
MKHSSGSTVVRHGLRPLAYFVFLVIGIAASAAPASAQSRAFVANTNLNNVTIINTAADSPDTRITLDVGVAPTQVVIGRDGTAFVANTGSNFISVISSDNSVSQIFLNDRPTSIALSPIDDRLYAMDAAGYLETVHTTTQDPPRTLFIGGDRGRIAVTPLGDQVYVASELVSVVDTERNALAVPSFAPETVASFDQGNSAVDVAIAPNGRVYVAVVTYHYDWMGFRADGGVAIVESVEGTPAVTKTIPLFSLPGSIALSADGNRAFAGIQSYWADTLYGAAFLPGRWVATIDTSSDITTGIPNDTVLAWTDLGATSVTWQGTHTPAGLAVTPDGKAVFVSIPTADSVAEIDSDTSLVTRLFQIDGGGASGVGVRPDAAGKPAATGLDAVDDNPPTAFSALTEGVVVANVLANDRIGGALATVANVVLSEVPEATDAGLTLNTATGAVSIAANVEAGLWKLTYRITDPGNGDNFRQAVVAVNVRPRFNLFTTDDIATSYAGVTAIANVLANDSVDVAAASSENVELSQLTKDSGLSLNADGAVFVTSGASPGSHGFDYQICDLTSLGNCKAGHVAVTVERRPIAAAPDSGSVARTGGVAVANVLANDRFENALDPAVGQVSLFQLPTSDTGLTLNTSTGAVSVAGGLAAGSRTLNYRVCEADTDNCSDAAVAVTIRATLIVATGESVRASNKNASVAVRNVLANDTLGGGPATLSNVQLKQVSTSNTKIRLNADGSVSVQEKAGSGTFALIYQICEIGNLSNCAQATVTIDLSGKN